MSRFAVTTPIYYVNDVPHLGNAYSTICADAMRRVHALIGDETFFLTGTDEHGLKIERQATEKGMSPQAFVDQASASFRAAWPKLLATPDHFVRTTDEAHKAFVKEIWKKIEANGDLYEGEYEDWYCVGCESFKTEKELEQPGNLCPLHKKPVERVKEKTYFFRLSKFEQRLLALYESRPDFIRPKERRNEVISFVKEGLRDLSVSRTSFKWGIPVPGNEGHVMYVWFDALTNYMSGLDAKGVLSTFWPKKDRDATVVHVVGKDILRFHAVYWPAFLFAAGYSEDELPTTVFAHGFLTVDGQKMGKSLRNAVDPLKLAEKFSPDVLRYQLLRSVSFGQDGDFDHAAMIERYNADLGKNLGNLLQRTLGLVKRLPGGKRPMYSDPTELETELVKDVETSLVAAKAAWKNMELNRAIELTWEASSRANQYVDRAAPWVLVKQPDTKRAETVLATLLEVLRLVAVAMWPVMPQRSDALLAQLGLPPVKPEIGKDHFSTTFSPLLGGSDLPEPTPLFPTYDKDQTKALLEELVPKPEAVAETKPAENKAAEAPKADGAPKADAAPKAEGAPITYDDFAKVDLRVGLVTACEKVPKKDKLLCLTIDLGEAAPRTIIAGLALTFTPEALVGKRVVVVANLAPRDFGKGLVSHGMVLATGPSEKLFLATAPDDVAPGSALK